MAINNHEYWIWTELLAFDNSQADYGVREYLDRVGKHPDGIALMLSHPDIALRHPGMSEEHVLFPENCTRRAHDRNAIRYRQDWTNYQLRGLVAELHKYDVLVFLSFFAESLGNQSHQEWLLQWRDAMLCDIDDNGRDFADYYAEKIQQTVLDYGFDGWHGADGQASGGWFMVGYFPIVRQKMFEKFMAPLGGLDAAPKIYQHIADDNVEQRRARSNWIWRHFPRQWQQFMTERWVGFEARIAEALHAVGKKVMLNSCEAKSIFEAGFYFGFDTRGFSKAGVDYILIESVATSCNLIYGTVDYPQRAHQIYSMVQELSAALPGLKVITMTGVCDPVESFNSIRHAPNMLERDIYFCANQCVVTPNGDKRCADGMLVCLGDSLKPHEWQFLGEYVDQATNFPVEGTDGYVWLYSSAQQDALPDSFMKYGTYAPYLMNTEMAHRGVMLPAICAIENLPFIEERPLFVPDFDMLPQQELETVMKRTALTVLIGNLQNCKLPENARVAIKTPVLDGYTLACVVLNAPCPIELKNLPGVEQHFDVLQFFRSVQDPAPKMDVNDAFWDECAVLMKSLIPHPLHGLGFPLIHKIGNGQRRIAIASHENKYFIPDFNFDGTLPHQMTLVSDYVCTNLAIKDGKLIGKGAERNFSQIFIPPQGLFLMEVQA